MTRDRKRERVKSSSQKAEKRQEEQSSVRGKNTGLCTLGLLLPASENFFFLLPAMLFSSSGLINGSCSPAEIMKFD